MMIGVRSPAPCSRAHTARPSSCGIIQSSTIRCGGRVSRGGAPDRASAGRQHESPVPRESVAAGRADAGRRQRSGWDGEPMAETYQSTRAMRTRLYRRLQTPRRRGVGDNYAWMMNTRERPVNTQSRQDFSLTTFAARVPLRSTPRRGVARAVLVAMALCAVGEACADVHADRLRTFPAPGMPAYGLPSAATTSPRSRPSSNLRRTRTRNMPSRSRPRNKANDVRAQVRQSGAACGTGGLQEAGFRQGARARAQRTNCAVSP